MKKLIYLLFFISIASFGQVSPKSEGQTSSIDVRGNNNIIKVIQGNGVKIYDLKDETQYQSFLLYLKAIPQISKELKQVLAYDKKTFELISKLVEKTQEFGIFDPTKFLEEFAKKVEEITKLKQENEALRKQTKDEELAQILEKANKLLETFDSKGYQKILEDFKQKSKEKLKKEQNEIAQVAFLQGENNRINNEFDKALEQLNEALALSPNNAEYLNSIGVTYHRKKDYDKALEYYLKAITIREKELGKEDLSTTSISNHIGKIYLIKRDYNKALEYYQKTLTIYKKVYGKEDIWTAHSYNDIGLTYYLKADYNTALEYFQNSSTIYENSYGKTGITADSYNDIGLTYYQKGDYNIALEYFQKALTIREKEHIRGYKSLDESYILIGLSYENKLDIYNALEYFQKALTIREKVLGKENLSTTDSYNNIYLIYSCKEYLKKALEYYKKVLTTDVKINRNVENYLSDAEVFDDIGLNYYKDFNVEPLDFFKRALNRRLYVLGKNHPSTAISYNNIGIYYFYKGDFDKAIEYFQNKTIICENILGKEHPLTDISYYNIGMTYIAKGEKNKGIAFLNRTWFEKESNYEKTKTINSFGNDTFKSNEFLAAINFYNLALEYLEKSNKGTNDEMYIVLYNNLAKAYCHNGDKEKALSLFRKSITLSKQTTMNLEEILNNYEKCKLK